MLGLCLMLLVVIRPVAASEGLTPQWTERYLFKHYPFLLKGSHTDHVLAFYYFGTHDEYTVMGMERVKGDDYTPHNTVLIFRNAELTGYYQDLEVFPSGVDDQGVIFFPPNSGISTLIPLRSESYPAVMLRDMESAFIPVP